MKPTRKMKGSSSQSRRKSMRMRQQRSQKKQMRTYKKRNTYKKRAGAFPYSLGSLGSLGEVTRPDPMDVIYIYKYNEKGPCYKGKIVITRGTKENNYEDDKMVDYTGHEYTSSPPGERRRIPTEITGRTQILSHLITNYLPDHIKVKYKQGMYQTTYKSVINNIKEYMKSNYIKPRIKNQCSNVEDGLKVNEETMSPAPSLN